MRPRATGCPPAPAWNPSPGNRTRRRRPTCESQAPERSGKTCTTPSGGRIGGTALRSSLPQQAMVLLVRSAQECCWPTVTARKSPSGGLACPSPLRPQQTMERSPRRAQVCRNSAATAVNRVAGVALGVVGGGCVVLNEIGELASQRSTRAVVGKKRTRGSCRSPQELSVWRCWSPNSILPLASLRATMRTASSACWPVAAEETTAVPSRASSAPIATRTSDALQILRTPGASLSRRRAALFPGARQMLIFTISQLARIVGRSSCRWQPSSRRMANRDFPGGRILGREQRSHVPREVPGAPTPGLGRSASLSSPRD